VQLDGAQSFDPDGGTLTYRWEIDDLGQALDAARIERAYPPPGLWSAQLIVTDDSGVQNASASDDITVRVNHAPVSEAGPDIVSDLLHVSFDASGSADADGDLLRHVWDFGDGATAQGEAPTHVFAGPGTYPVTLTVDDGTGLANAQHVDTMTVVIRDQPIADAGGNRDVCSGVPILFDASASVNPDGGLLSYSWDFGDGSGSDLINPSKVYEQPGAYPVTLTVRNETGTEYGTAMDRIAALVREGPIADAGPDLTVCSHQEVRFDGSGSSDADGAVNAYNWSFGDGGEGSGATPAYIFDQPGIYTVTLTITGDAAGECSPYDSDTALVQVKPAPVLEIVGPERVGAGLDAPFEAEISGGGNVTHVTWDFGDGTTGEGEAVSHTYAEPGEYLITLRASLGSGTEGCTELETLRKVIVNAAPEPAITSPDLVSVGEAVIFDGSDSQDPDGAVISYLWAFGDGATSKGVAASHVFTQPGDYTVSLTVLDDSGVGNSEVTHTRDITVLASPAVGLVAPQGICPGEPVEWTAPISAQWQIGDELKDGASVTHSFDAPGLFPVRVTMDDGKGGLGSVTSEQVYARVNRSPPALAGADRIVCPGQEVTFDAGASGDLDGVLTGWEWRFSDGVVLNGATVTRSFDQAGDLDVTLVVRDDSGAQACDTATDTARIRVNAPPQIGIGPDLEIPVGGAHDVVRFEAQGGQDQTGQDPRVVWTFGDGAQAEGASVTHRFAAPGQYEVTAQAHDPTGLSCGIGQSSLTVTAIARD
jgi:PKD repeat protein